MNIFISWSGDLSRELANILNDWIPTVIQAAKPWYSPDDIAKGTRWFAETGKKLEDSHIGIICLTKGNLEAPWILFETGALSKNIGKSKICPILFDVKPSEITGPLIQFQCSKFEKEEIKKLLMMINKELGEQALSTEIFNTAFEMSWPRLEKKVKNTMNKQKNVQHIEVRSDRDILEEILMLQRTLINAYNKTLIVDELELSIPTQNILRNACIKTIGDLLSFEERQLLLLRNIGHKDLVEIKNSLAKYGLKLINSENEIQK